jgi:beta-glucanase (GH16 family)
MEARGNGPEYTKQGRNYVRGSLNWGPTSWLNAVHKTYGWWNMRRSGYDQDFHTYALEWTEDWMRIYVDTRLHHMLDMRFNKPFWARGEFPAVVQNGSNTIALTDPWQAKATVTNAAPFDQQFYLIMNVAVGGTNGWFPDNAGDKPWIDNSKNAMSDFAKNQETWYNTWPQGDNINDRAMIVDSVKMWTQC